MGYDAALADYTKFDFTHEGRTFPVYRRGSGPAVIIMHEVPGLHPQVIRFADRVAAAGMTVFCPSLFGKPGKPATKGYATATILGLVCIRREFYVWRGDRSSPVVDWLKALSRQAHAECGGRGVGAVGMCFTGGFALAMMTDPSVVAPVLSQPSLPLGVTAAQRGDPGLSEDELMVVERRAKEDGLCALGLRFSADRMSPSERFQTLRNRLGDAFEVIEIDSGPGNSGGFGKMAHSVLTLEVRDVEGQQAYQARERVVQFLKERLTV